MAGAERSTTSLLSSEVVGATLRPVTVASGMLGRRGNGRLVKDHAPLPAGPPPDRRTERFNCRLGVPTNPVGQERNIRCQESDDELRRRLDNRYLRLKGFDKVTLGVDVSRTGKLDEIVVEQFSEPRRLANCRLEQRLLEPLQFRCKRFSRCHWYVPKFPGSGDSPWSLWRPQLADCRDCLGSPQATVGQPGAQREDQLSRRAAKANNRTAPGICLPLSRRRQ